MFYLINTAIVDGHSRPYFKDTGNTQPNSESWTDNIFQAKEFDDETRAIYIRDIYNSHPNLTGYKLIVVDADWYKQNIKIAIEHMLVAGKKKTNELLNIIE